MVDMAKRQRGDMRSFAIVVIIIVLDNIAFTF